jgi:phage anti-repressor protein
MPDLASINPELVPLIGATIGDRTFNAVNARDLHAFLDVGRDFSTWIKGRIEEYGFLEEEDYSPVLVNQKGFDSPNPVNQNGRGGDRRSIDYLITLDMAKELAMIENSDKGRAARRYFIKCESRLLEALAQQPIYPYTRLSERPRAAPLSAETRQSLQNLRLDLRITGEFEIANRPQQPHVHDTLSLVCAALDDIVHWRYPFPFAYALSGSGRGQIILNIHHLISHFLNAPHFQEFLHPMNSRARWWLEQELTSSGMMRKIKRGPVIDEERMSYSLDLEELRDKLREIRERLS